MSLTPSHPYFRPRASRPPMAFSTPSAQLGFARAFFTNVVPLTCIAGAGAFAQYLYTLSLAYVPMSTGAQLGAWAALPALLMLGPWVKPTLQQVGWMRNEWMEEVIREKVYPALPGGEVDEEGVEKSPEFAVLMIGARCNGPFGGLHKGFAEIGKGFVQMWKDLEEDPKSGLLNVEQFMGTSRTLNNGLMTIGTFRSTADVHAFARKDLHRSLMKLYRTLPAERAEMFEIWHELYTIKAGGSEGIYINSTPHGLGGIFVPSGAEAVEFEGSEESLAEEGKSEQRWESVLRLAKGRNATSRGRMGMKL